MLHGLVPLLVALALAAPALADHEAWHCAPARYVEAGGFYVVLDPLPSAAEPGLYQETNGVPGLQRGAASPLLHDPPACLDDPLLVPDVPVV